MARVRAWDSMETEPWWCGQIQTAMATFAGEWDGPLLPWKQHQQPSSGAISDFEFLPEELCIKIFRFLRPIEDELPGLALVCRKWRHILQRYSSLWRHMYIDPRNWGWRQASLLATLFRLYGHHVHTLEWRPGAPVYESMFALIPRLNSLRRLRLPVLWTRAVVESLAPLERLEEIEVHGGFAVTDEELILIASQFPKLRVVSLSGCWAVTATGVTRFITSLKTLTTVKLKVNSNLRLSDSRAELPMAEGVKIARAVGSIPRRHMVTVLCLHFVSMEMDDLWSLVGRLTALRKLTVSNCENLNAIRLKSESLQKIYLYNLWHAMFVSINAANLRLLTIDHGLESMEHLEVMAPRLRRLILDGSNVLRTLRLCSDRLVVIEMYHCKELALCHLKEALTENRNLACLKIGQIAGENFSLDEICCPGLQELCLLSDFNCNSLHIRSPTLRLIHTQSEVDLQKLSHIYVVANHLCKLSLVGVPALTSLIVQCVSVDSIELNLCSDDKLCLESCVIQALSALGFLRLFDCQVNLLSVHTPLAKTVVLYRCQMSDYVLQMALTGCPNIAHLNIEKCRSLTHVNIQAPPMKYLNMFGCANVHRLNLDCPQMIGINLGQCHNMRLFINGIEKKLHRRHRNDNEEDMEVILPYQTTRWTHDYPPEEYPS